MVHKRLQGLDEGFSGQSLLFGFANLIPDHGKYPRCDELKADKLPKR